jgi:hypothetical protein
MWGVSKETITACNGLGRLMGETWDLFLKVIKGEYPTSPRNKERLPVFVDTHSQFSSAKSISEADLVAILSRVLNGDLKVQKIRDACLEVMAYTRLRKLLVETIDNLADQETDGASPKYDHTTNMGWAFYRQEYPTATSPGFVFKLVPVVLACGKNKPVPDSFFEAIKKQIEVDRAKSKTTASSRHPGTHARKHINRTDNICPRHTTSVI